MRHALSTAFLATLAVTSAASAQMTFLSRSTTIRASSSGDGTIDAGTTGFEDFESGVSRGNPFASASQISRLRSSTIFFDGSGSGGGGAGHGYGSGDSIFDVVFTVSETRAWAMTGSLFASQGTASIQLINLDSNTIVVELWDRSPFERSGVLETGRYRLHAAAGGGGGGNGHADLLFSVVPTPSTMTFLTVAGLLGRRRSRPRKGQTVSCG